MGKGPYGDIPDENVIFNYASSHNITFHGSDDSGFTIEEWNDMTPEQQNEAILGWMWSSDLIEIWASEETE